MKILSLNAWQGRLERALLKQLRTYKADFACIQEAVDYDGWPAGLASTYDTLGDAMRLEYRFFSPLLSNKLGAKDISFGNATYSNLPFSSTSTLFTRGEFNNEFDFDSDDYNIRAFQHTAIDIDGKSLHIINHHGHHINEHKLGDDETMRQVQQIVDYVKQLQGAIIVAGDFNLSPDSKSIKLLNDTLRNLPVEHSLQTTRSLLTNKNEVCDYVFVNDAVQVNDFSMDTTIISDHNALILDFDLK